MKHFQLFFLLLCSVLMLCKGFQQSVDSSVTEVSLFGDGALVTRQSVPIVVEAGITTLLFKSLPYNVDTSAIQANFANDGTCKGHVKKTKIYHKSMHDDHEDIKETKEQLNEGLQEKAAKERALTKAKDAVRFIKDIQKSFSQEFGKNSMRSSNALEQARDLIEFVSHSSEEVHSQINSLEVELTAIDESIKGIEQNLIQAQQRHSESIDVEIEIEMYSADEVILELSYLAEGASWNPQYELKAIPEEGSLKITYLASIQQKTGEDWSNITLSINTNDVLHNGNVPIPSPFHVKEKNMLRPTRHYERDYEKYASTDLYSGKFSSNIVLEDSGNSLETEITTSTVSFQATIPGEVSIPSSHESSIYKIIDGSVEADYWSEAVPRSSLDAYLRARIRNTLGIPILPGNALAFVDGKLSSKVSLHNILPGEKAKVSLGIDPLVSVKRTKGALKDKTSGLLVETTKTLSREYKNEVTNLHETAHRVITVDQFPIARDDKIHIYRKEPATDTSNVTIEDENNGIFHWDYTLAPKERRTFRIAYDVAFPHAWAGLSVENI